METGDYFGAFEMAVGLIAFLFGLVAGWEARKVVKG